MNVVGGGRVPITVRGLAAAPLARGGSIEVDAIHLRDRAVSWIALALLLTSWNVEAQLDAEVPAAPLARAAASAGPAADAGYDWRQSKPTRWTSCAARTGDCITAAHKRNLDQSSKDGWRRGIEAGCARVRSSGAHWESH